MWMHAAAQPFKYNSGRTTINDLKEPEDAHTHSPKKYRSRAAAVSGGPIQPPPPFYGTLSRKDFQAPPTQWSDSQGEPIWARREQDFVGDPFGDAYIIDHHRGSRSSQSDISMPDYQSSTSSSSRAMSGITGISYEHSKQPSIAGLLNDDQYGQVFRTFTPPKEPVSVIQPGSFMPMGFKLSAAAEARSTPHGKSADRRPLPSVLKDMSLSGIRDVSGHSSKSNGSDPFDSVAGSEIADQFYASPEIQSKSRQASLVQDEKDNPVAFETPRKGGDKIHQTPTKTPLQTSVSLESIT